MVPSRLPHAGPPQRPQAEDVSLGSLCVAGGVGSDLRAPSTAGTELCLCQPQRPTPSPSSLWGPSLGLRPGPACPALPCHTHPPPGTSGGLQEPCPVPGAGLSRGPPRLTPASGGPPAPPCQALGLSTWKHCAGSGLGRGPQGAVLPSAPKVEGVLGTGPPCHLPCFRSTQMSPALENSSGETEGPPAFSSSFPMPYGGCRHVCDQVTNRNQGSKRLRRCLPTAWVPHRLPSPRGPLQLSAQNHGQLPGPAPLPGPALQREGPPGKPLCPSFSSSSSWRPVSG